MAWMVSVDLPKLYWYFNFIRSLRSGATFAEFGRRLVNIFGSDVDPSRAEQYQSLESIEDHRTEFEALILWLRDQP
jgi:hypothetical protein